MDSKISKNSNKSSQIPISDNNLGVSKGGDSSSSRVGNNENISGGKGLEARQLEVFGETVSIKNPEDLDYGVEIPSKFFNTEKRLYLIAQFFLGGLVSQLPEMPLACIKKFDIFLKRVVEIFEKYKRIFLLSIGSVAEPWKVPVCLGKIEELRIVDVSKDGILDCTNLKALKTLKIEMLRGSIINLPESLTELDLGEIWPSAKFRVPKGLKNFSTRSSQKGITVDLSGAKSLEYINTCNFSGSWKIKSDQEIRVNRASFECVTSGCELNLSTRNEVFDFITIKKRGSVSLENPKKAIKSIGIRHLYGRINIWTECSQLTILNVYKGGFIMAVKGLEAFFAESIHVGAKVELSHLVGLKEIFITNLYGSISVQEGVKLTVVNKHPGSEISYFNENGLVSVEVVEVEKKEFDPLQERLEKIESGEITIENSSDLDEYTLALQKLEEVSGRPFIVKADKISIGLKPTAWDDYAPIDGKKFSEFLSLCEKRFSRFYRLSIGYVSEDFKLPLLVSLEYLDVEEIRDGRDLDCGSLFSLKTLVIRVLNSQLGKLPPTLERLEYFIGDIDFILPENLPNLKGLYLPHFKSKQTIDISKAEKSLEQMGMESYAGGLLIFPKFSERLEVLIKSLEPMTELTLGTSFNKFLCANVPETGKINLSNASVKSVILHELYGKIVLPKELSSLEIRHIRVGSSLTLSEKVEKVIIGVLEKGMELDLSKLDLSSEVRIQDLYGKLILRKGMEIFIANEQEGSEVIYV